MSHRIWRETMHDPSKARSGNKLSCCLLSLRFLCDILRSGTVVSPVRGAFTKYTCDMSRKSAASHVINFRHHISRSSSSLTSCLRWNGTERSPRDRSSDCTHLHVTSCNLTDRRRTKKRRRRSRVVTKSGHFCGRGIGVHREDGR